MLSFTLFCSALVFGSCAVISLHLAFEKNEYELNNLCTILVLTGLATANVCMFLKQIL